MTRLFIKYQNNSPVSLLTQSLPSVLQGEEPVVGDLIAAYKTAVAPRFDSTPIDELTLHSINELETSYNSWDPLTILGENGKTGTRPLILKSKNDMEVDSSPKRSGSSNSDINIKNHGIDLDTQHLGRLELVDKLVNLVSSNTFVLLTSPAGSGKSSLIKLYQAATKKRVIEISCLDVKPLFELLKAKGIEFENKNIKLAFPLKNVVFFLDDAQAQYGEAEFWGKLIKATDLWLPRNIKFIISATHMLNGVLASPAEFESLPRLSREDFLLSEAEAYEFLDLSDIGLPRKMGQFHSLKTVLVKQAGGLIAALRLSVDFLKESFMKDNHPPETILHQRCFVKDFFENMARCFPKGRLNPVGDDFKQLLQHCFLDDKTPVIAFKCQQDEDTYSSMKKAGILVESPDKTFGFSSMIAKQYYFKWIFTDRAPSGL